MRGLEREVASPARASAPWEALRKVWVWVGFDLELQKRASFLLFDDKLRDKRNRTAGKLS